jgi:acetyl esterase/lipase
LHFVGRSTPPALLLVGEEDGLADPWTALDWSNRMQSAGGAACRVFIYRRTHHPSGHHDIKNPVENDNYRQVDLFLASLGFLQGPPTVAALDTKVSSGLYVTADAFRTAHPTPVRPLQPAAAASRPSTASH